MQDAASNVRGITAALDARIAAEQSEARRVHEEEVAALEVSRRAANDAHEAEMARRRERWPLGEARDLVRSGYSIEHTSIRTGWAEEELEDVIPDEW